MVGNCARCEKEIQNIRRAAGRLDTMQIQAMTYEYTVRTCTATSNIQDAINTLASKGWRLVATMASPRENKWHVPFGNTWDIRLIFERPCEEKGLPQ